MGKNYYCLVAGLPDLQFDDGKLAYSAEQFREEVYAELTEADKQLLDLLRIDTDHRNLLALLKDKDAGMEKGGLLAAEQLTALIQAVKDDEKPADKSIPTYMYHFVQQYLAEGDNHHQLAEDLLWLHYYQHAMQCRNRFVSEWFEFNLNVNNLFAALTARKFKMDVAPLLVGDTEVCRQIRTSNARDFGLSDQLDYMEALLHIVAMDNLAEREKKLDLMKWNWLDDHCATHYFGVERIFACLAKLQMVTRWAKLDKETGGALFRQLIADMKHDVQLPAM